MDIRVESEKRIEEIKKELWLKRNNEETKKETKKVENIKSQDELEGKEKEKEKETKEELHLSKKEKFIKQILEREEVMFKAITTAEPSIYKKKLKLFKLRREAKFSAYSNRTLKGYLIDLKNAAQTHRNLVTERYARKGDLVFSEVENQLIRLIVATEKEWFLKLNTKYPHAMGNSGNFLDYLEGELYTYSELTIKYYFEDLKQAKLVGENLVEKRYLTMYRKLGYSSLQEAEESYLKEEEK